MTSAPSHIKKKFLEGLRLAYKLQVGTLRPLYEIKYVELHGKNRTEFPVDTGFLCNNASITGELLRNMIKNPACIS
jgi:hypothetical protein